MNERQALALLESGKPLRDIIRENAHDLEVHLDVGRGMYAKAKLDIDEAGEWVTATAMVEDAKGPVEIKMKAHVTTADAWVREAVDLNWAEKAGMFLSGRGGARKAVFARRLNSPVSKAERKYVPLELIAKASELP